MASEYIGTGKPDGVIVGRSDDKLAFYGTTATTQPAMTVAVGTDLATVILELAEIRAALVTLGLIDQ